MKLIEVLNKTDDEIKEIVILSKLIPETMPPLFKSKSFKMLSYEQVIELKGLIQNNFISIDLICKLALFNDVDFKENDLNKVDAKNYFSTINFIEREFEQIAEMEKRLETQTDPKLIQAGIHNLKQFGELNIIDTLARGNILDWERILKLTWIDVYNKLLKSKIEADIRDSLDMQREMENQIKNKTK